MSESRRCRSAECGYEIACPSCETWFDGNEITCPECLYVVADNESVMARGGGLDRLGRVLFAVPKGSG